MERNTERYFLIEIDRDNNEHILQENYNGSGFQRTSYPQYAKAFKTLEEVKKAVELQTMMNTFFDEEATVYYVYETLQREVFDKNDEKQEE